MLFGLPRFRALVQRLEAVGASTACEMGLSMTTNGVLVTREWADFCREHSVRVAVSIDGTEAIHDKVRPNLGGGGSHREAVRGFTWLKEADVDPSIIAVCDPESDPAATLHFFAETLGCDQFDILPPDLNHHNAVRPIHGSTSVCSTRGTTAIWIAGSGFAFSPP